MVQLVAAALAVEVHQHPHAQRHAVGDAEFPGAQQRHVAEAQRPGGGGRELGR